MEYLEHVALVLIGLVTGLVGGMLGIGGSIVAIPAMTEVLGPNQHVYQAAAMILNFFVAAPAVYQHARAKAIERATVLRLIPLAIVAIIVGVVLSELPIFAGPRQMYLCGLFGLFILCISIHELYVVLRGKRRQPSEPAASAPGAERATTPVKTPIPRSHWRFAGVVAIPTGVIAGLLGVGGGIVAVPLQRRFLNVPMRSAIANSATTIVAISLIGATLKNYALIAGHGGSWESFRIAAILIPTAIVGSFIGGYLTHRLPMTVIKVAFFVLLFAAGARLVYRAAGPLSPPPVPLRVGGTAPALPSPLAGFDNAPLWQEGSTSQPSCTDRSVRGTAADTPIADMGAGLRPSDRRSIMRRPTKMRSARATVIGLGAIAVTSLVGCDSDFAKEFREAATPSLHSGVSAILDGVVDGVFAVMDPDNTDTTP